MLVDDAINLISRDFSNYKAGGRSVPLNTPFANERHPDAIQVLLNMLADNHQLTVLQYDRVIKYLEMKREEQVQVELGDVKDLPTTTTTIAVSDPKQAELQSRILNILNSNKTSSSVPAPSPVPAPTSAPAPVPPATWGSGKSYKVSLFEFKLNRYYIRYSKNSCTISNIVTWLINQDSISIIETCLQWILVLQKLRSQKNFYKELENYTHCKCSIFIFLVSSCNSYML